MSNLKDTMDWKKDLIEEYPKIPAGVRALLIADIEEIIEDTRQEFLEAVLPKKKDSAFAESEGGYYYNKCLDEIKANAKKLYNINL